MLLDEFVTGFHGFQVYDALDSQWHTARMALLYSVTDTRGLEPLTNGLSHPGRAACHLCELPGVYVKALHTTVYPGSWRNLPAASPLRQQLVNYNFTADDVSKNDRKRPLVIGLQADAPPPRKRTRKTLRIAGIIAERSSYPISHKKHPSRQLFVKKPNYIAQTLKYFDPAMCFRVDHAHALRNLLDAMVGCAIMSRGGSLNEKRLLLEVNRGRWTEAQLSSKPYPWAMTAQEIEKVNAEIQSMRIPRSLGSRLRGPLNPVNISYYSMHDAHRVMDDMLIYALHRADAYATDTRYRQLWCDMILWWKKFRKRSITRDDIQRLTNDAYILHATAELLLPSAFLTWSFHYFTHMADSIRICGPAPLWSMFAYERSGSMISKQTKSKKGLETGMMQTHRVRELVSLLRLHDPTIYDFLSPTEASGEGMCVDALLAKGDVDRAHSFDRWVAKPSRVKPINLNDEDVMRADALYVKHAYLRQEMERRLIESGSSLNVRDLRVVHDAHSVDCFTVGRKVLRTVGSIPYAKPVEGGLCTVKYDDNDGLEGYGYGEIKRMFTHKIYNHPLSPSVVVLEVMPWKVDFGTTSLLRARQPRADQASILLLHSDVVMCTYLMKPAITADLGSSRRCIEGRHHAYTHNLIFLG